MDGCKAIKMDIKWSPLFPKAAVILDMKSEKPIVVGQRIPIGKLQTSGRKTA
jgi:hypothetical protein